jgi:iron complex outermembrane receptor protein
MKTDPRCKVHSLRARRLRAQPLQSQAQPTMRRTCAACLLTCLVLQVAVLETARADEPGSSAAADEAADTEASPHDHGSHEVDHIHHDDFEEIVVTASPLGRSRFDVLQGTSVLQGEELQRRRNSSLGQTLYLEPGINSDFFSPAASRPVIRGQAGVRVEMLNNGLRVLDASSESPDHAVVAESLTAQRIEVIRGPASLLYGSAASGGVVNVMTGRIVTEAPEDGWDVFTTGDYGSNGNLGEGGAMLNAQAGDFVVHVDGFGRQQGDFEIPGYAESKQLMEEEGETPTEPPSGVVENSDLKAGGAGAGVSWLRDWGYVGLSGGYQQSNYGVPGHEHEEDPPPAEPEPPVRIDLKQWRIDAAAEASVDLAVFEKGEFRFGYSRYEHVELEGSEVGTTFNNDGFDMRLELAQKSWGSLDGAVGFQVTQSEFGAVGEEAFVPPADTVNFGLFAFEEYALDDWVEGLGVDVGLRYEHQSVDAEANPDRTFDGFSISGGVGWNFHPDWLVGATGFRNERLPQSVELYSDGPHLATASYDIGDDTLGKEVAKGIELAFRRQGGRLTGGIGAFYTAYDNFVYRQNQGFELDGLPVYQYTADGTEFYGGEFDAHYTVWEHDDFSVGVDLVVDYVRALVKDGGGDLPLIPPLRVLSGVEFNSFWVDAHLETIWAAAQNAVPQNELPTDAYVLVNLFVELRPIRGERDFSLFMNARNLGNVEARSASSALKDLVPLPGRDFRVGATLQF